MRRRPRSRRIIVDDLTQHAVFAEPVTFPVTYLSLQATTIHRPIAEAMQVVRPNYAILQCQNMNLIGVKADAVLGGLCCYNFRSGLHFEVPGP